MYPIHVRFRGCALAIVLTMIAWACSVEAQSKDRALNTLRERVEAVAQPLIYGADDRREVFEFDDNWIRSAAEASLVAIGLRTDINDIVDGALAVPSAAERLSLCPEERFGNQPGFALCTGIALDGNVVLTASHCLRAGPLQELVAVTSYFYEAPGQLAALGDINVSAIEAVVQRDDELGYAWLRLYGARELRPVQVSDAPIVNGEAVISLNHGMRVPAKVDTGGRAYVVNENSFLSTVDAFGGASGGPVFSTSGALLGILIAGGADYQRSSRGCVTALHTLDSAARANEFVLRAGVAIQGLCSGYGGASLCGDTTRVSSMPGCAFHDLAARGRNSPWYILPLVPLAVCRRRARARDKRTDYTSVSRERCAD